MMVNGASNIDTAEDVEGFIERLKHIQQKGEARP